MVLFLNDGRHSEKKKCPRLPAATIAALTAATGEVLTEFMGSRPTDLGHSHKVSATLRAVNGQGTETP